MTQRISQAKLQRVHSALQAVIAAIIDAKSRYSGCKDVRPRLSGLSRFLRELKGLPDHTDYSVFEVQLKRRLVRAQHRIFGHQIEGREGGAYAVSDQLPSIYAPTLARYNEAARALLRSLSDVDIAKNHQPLVSVAALMPKKPVPAQPQSEPVA